MDDTVATAREDFLRARGAETAAEVALDAADAEVAALESLLHAAERRKEAARAALAAAREPVTQDDPWPTEPLCDHYSPPNRCAAAGCPHAPQPVTQDECSYCLHRPAVGMTVDEDSICDECAVPVPPPGEAAVRHVLGSYGVDDLDVVGFDNLVRDLLAARGDAGPRP
jgi:hypothetical protein